VAAGAAVAGIVGGVLSIASGSLTLDGGDETIARNLEYASLGFGVAEGFLGLPSLVRGMANGIKGAARTTGAGVGLSKTITWGGRQTNFTRTTNGIQAWEDTYKSGRRLNISGHGYPVNTSGTLTGVLTDAAHRAVPVDLLCNRLNQAGINFSNYSFARLIMCGGGAGGSLSYAQKFADASLLRTKAFTGLVTTSHSPEQFARINGQLAHIPRVQRGALVETSLYRDSNCGFMIDKSGGYRGMVRYFDPANPMDIG
jgi:hypothetical protein